MGQHPELALPLAGGVRPPAERAPEPPLVPTEGGFGLPPLEALAMGKPVILSDIPVYRELYSKWASFFPPGDAEGLANSITETLAAPAMVPGRQELEATFSWAETARVTAAAYDRALS